MAIKIVIFGSTGGTGRLILGEAVRRGHDVTAFARDADALSDVPGAVRVIEGDGRDPSAVATAVAGRQAVIMTVSGGGQPGVATAIARTVTAAMQAHAVTRLVATSAYGLVATKPYVVASLVRRVFAKDFADQLAADAVIRETGLDWTILRATRLSGGRPKRPPRQSSELFMTGPYSVARVAYASALLDLAENGAHPRQILHITG